MASSRSRRRYNQFLVEDQFLVPDEEPSEILNDDSQDSNDGNMNEDDFSENQETDNERSESPFEFQTLF